ncbi:hypothetical protein CI238_09927 [Colletotrichum incanum]|uniref:Uncharacterized protein n=1 Tax=Colletotrichum incanum TaxID=1573173 RepID=A0A161WHY7_COLIC|nr:hypothetical protein CI238_09927 [Colletotrichum incanum]
MDPFNKLPAELRVEIIVSIRSRRTIVQLIQASPVMLGQYLKSKGYITRTLLASDLDDEMIQDAMAIILFPSQCTTGHFATLARRHCQSWAAQQLRNPLRKPSKKRNRRFIKKLDKLHVRLLFFIEDYRTKATAVFPPREYICLSGSSPIQNQLTFKGQPCSDAWLPKITPDSTSSHTPGVLYPDNLYFNPNAYAFDMGWQRNDFSIVSELAGFGFDLVTIFLRSAIAGRPGRERLRQWFMDVCPGRAPGSGFKWTYFDCVSLGHYHSGVEEEDHQNGPGMYRMLYPLISGSSQMHKNIYRKRA